MASKMELISDGLQEFESATSIFVIAESVSRGVDEQRTESAPQLALTRRRLTTTADGHVAR